MGKDVSHRIAYFTRKLAQFGAHHPAKKQPRSHKYRHQRLMQFKDAMHKLIAEHQSRVTAALQGD